MKHPEIETSNYRGIPAMSPPEVHTYLKELGNAWSSQGCAIEVGCWLGATSVALLDGLVEAGYDLPFWAFDRWMANVSEVRKAAQQHVRIRPRQDLKPIYHKNVSPVYNDIRMIQGNVPRTLQSFPAQLIEFCMFDAPKRNPVFQKTIDFFIPHFIPGVTILGLLDYHFYLRRRLNRKGDWEEFLAPVKFIEQFSENFTLLRDFEDNGSCVFFRYEKVIS